MYLIDVSRLLSQPLSGKTGSDQPDTGLVQKFDNIPPPYAILSHRWFGQDEVSFQDMHSESFQHLLHHSTLGKSAEKIRGSCLKAKEKGISYLWDDTCCIDKNANAKENLNESYASMFKWYHESELCLVYLSDVPKTRFGKSEWFGRGWTLQELLAPKKLEFFDQSWQYLGNRDELSDQIQATTSIAPKYFVNFSANTCNASVAMKMSWASKRTVTRIEDTAYSLFGIFDVTIDIRYGEGKKAFRRLQEEIIRNSEDESIFAWKSDEYEFSGMLAPWIDCFKDSHEIRLRPEKYRSRGAYSITNNVLEFPVPIYIAGGGIKHNDLHYLLKDIRNHFATRVKLPLYCWKMTENGWRAVNIYISKKSGNWRRTACDELSFTKRIKSTSRVDFTRIGIMEKIRIQQVETRKIGDRADE